jgi:hypothetical protein
LARNIEVQASIIGLQVQGERMKSRIAVWATLGALVVVGWRLYIAATLSNPLGRGGLGRALVFLTCPIAMGSHHPQGFYFVLVANAATYALAGLLFETARREYSSARKFRPLQTSTP